MPAGSGWPAASAAWKAARASLLACRRRACLASLAEEFGRPGRLAGLQEVAGHQPSHGSG